MAEVRVQIVAPEVWLDGVVAKRGQAVLVDEAKAAWLIARGDAVPAGHNTRRVVLRAKEGE